jgi:D-cysteine desulfhydrase
MLPEVSKITADEFTLPAFEKCRITADLLRLDKIHPVISGNKWFKLKFHLENFFAGNYNGLITFGGAWSNHIVATACACFLQKIKCVGIIRGEKPAQLSFTLQQAESYGMQLKFISRADYKQKDKAECRETIGKEFPGYYFIPEGGAGPAGEKGAAEILQLANPADYSHIICAVGTGTMMRGLAMAAKNHKKIIGIPVLKFSNENHRQAGIVETRHALCLPKNTGYHFGGYAKYNGTLIEFMNEFYRQTAIPTDFVYTGKLMFAVNDLAVKNFFPPGSRLLIIHSGGLQGNASLPKGTLIF